MQLHLPARRRSWRRRSLHRSGPAKRTVDQIREQLGAERDAGRNKHEAVFDPPTIRMHRMDVPASRRFGEVPRWAS